MGSHLSREERIDLLDEALQDNWDFGQWVVALVEGAGTYLSLIVGEEWGNKGMLELMTPVRRASGYSDMDGDWRRVIELAMPDIYHIWPIAEKLNEVAAYAVYGVLVKEDIVQAERPAYVRTLVEEAVAFLEASPISIWKLTDREQDIHLTRLVRLASNRLALEDGHSVEPFALAEFGGLSEGRIRNMMSGADRKFSSEGGRIPAVDALAWLKSRPDFYDSIWNSNVDSLKTPPTLGIASDDAVIFVPMAHDGTPFHPGLMRSGNFTIGQRGYEEQIPDYDDALGRLHRMAAPRWRRPNDAGNWGIVRGTEWRRFSQRELSGLPAKYRLPTVERSGD